MAAFPAPADAYMALLAAFITGNVRVTRQGGGLGESEMGATATEVSYDAKLNITN